MAKKDVRGTRDDVRSKAPSTIAQKRARLARMQHEMDSIQEEIAALQILWEDYVRDRDALRATKTAA